MCELMTIAAALVFTAWYFAAKRQGKSASAVFSAMLMFWGAALMWAVDCVANAMGGEALLDISGRDFLLGLIVWGAGLAVFGVLFMVEKKRAFKSA